MPVSIDATVGGTSANSFVTLTEAQTYLDGRLNESSWESATTDNKNRALVEAARELSARSWRGMQTTDTQALAWPREWVVNPDSPTYSYFDTDIIPQRVKNAQIELALEFIKAGTTDVATQDPLQNIKQETVGPLTTVYADVYQRARGLARYPNVLRFIRPLLSGVGLTTRVLRG